MSGGGADRAAEAARQDEQQREMRIGTGTRNIRAAFRNQFTDEYYKDLEKTGKNTYEPEVQKQYEDSLSNLRAALLRSGQGGMRPDGTYGSSVGRQMESDLAEQRTRAGQDVMNRVQGIMNQRRQNIANAELTSIGQLQSSGNDAAAAAQAQNLIDVNSQREAWSPLGQVFTDATAGLATQAELERDNRARYNVGVSNWLGRPSGRYTTTVGG